MIPGPRQHERSAANSQVRVNVFLHSREQAGDQRRAPRQTLGEHVLVRGVGALALSAEAIECRYADSSGEVAVAAAAGRTFVDSNVHRGGDRARLGKEI